ncbi:methyltransferase domain-containing protein [Cyanobacteria bacterium FACHB-DQ100]|nr:methyltransferase domain-containing protein [Cyanobacteria bacterium FACHB-DQ100]
MSNSTSSPINSDLAYANYWKRKELLANSPHFPTKHWWADSSFSEIEQIIFDRIKAKSTILDVGAGDLRIQQKFYRAGFQGVYHTQDIGQEFTYTYSTLEEIDQKYEAVLCFDTIEHLELRPGLALLHQLIDRVETGGLLVIQTPNARCISNPLSWDMTHLHCYSIHDLWAYLTSFGLKVEGYRVIFGKPSRNLIEKFSSLASRLMITRLLGHDYAANIVLIAQKL